MSQTVRKQGMSVGEFIDWSRLEPGDTRYELVDGEPVAMAPETWRHMKVKSTAWLTFRNAIRESGLPCEAAADGIGVPISDETLREPDFSVHCGEIDESARVFETPVIVGEVLSPSSLRSDTGQKLAEYFSLASVRHYLIVDPVARRLILHSRAASDGAIATVILGADDTVTLDPPGLRLAVADLFGDR